MRVSDLTHCYIYIWVDQYKFIDNGSNTFNNNHNNKRRVLKKSIQALLQCALKLHILILTTSNGITAKLIHLDGLIDLPGIQKATFSK